MKMLKKAIIGCIFCLLPFALFSAEVQVEPGDATLSAAITACDDGDVLVLQDGGEYRETDQTVLPIAVDGIELTIKAEDGYSTRPVISFPAFPSGGNIAAETFGFELSDCDFTVQGLEFDCGMADTSQYKALAALFNISWETTLQMIDKFTIDDCFIHHVFWPWVVLYMVKAVITPAPLLESILVSSPILSFTKRPKQ
ncbi:MAG: hypothetical protein U5R06_05480 [candidate division KSB1 bacterium]|nr:hypothetical protein [candidate division KSB1 bacterium]